MGGGGGQLATGASRSKKQEKTYNNNTSKYLKDLNQVSALPGVMGEAGVGTASGGGGAGRGGAAPLCPRGTDQPTQRGRRRQK